MRHVPHVPTHKGRYTPTLDVRVQAIRCMDCHRLRLHPNNGARNCGCGSIRFVSTFPHPDEEQLAIKLYSKELEESNVYTKISQEIVLGWDNNDFR